MQQNEKKCPFLGKTCEEVSCAIWSVNANSCSFLLAAEALNNIEVDITERWIPVASYDYLT